ncbi:alpha/beta hydrolase [Shewanella sp. WXL01]|uniref:alpha/beta hydrolase n=1 Tax=Shewanella sp. WXL01 TaxID=2709721 RepID=UPI0014386945|nr:alpha/beta hydrolase-fold protein [Shewanella sp. WXL01]NKF51646.1 alpha/beta hydrolase [Shewanella sp. WXL01]
MLVLKAFHLSLDTIKSTTFTYRPIETTAIKTNLYKAVRFVIAATSYSALAFSLNAKELPASITANSAESALPKHITQVNETYTVGNTEKFTLSSNVVARKYDILVKLPKGYFAQDNSKVNYPVLYLNDAPHTFKVATGVTHFPSMDKAIIVAMGFAHGENGQYSRVRDLTPHHAPSWVKYKTGGAGEYLKLIEQEVIPFIEQRYRVDSSKRILSGHSLGGSFGSWVMLSKPELFSSYILTSPSHWFKDDQIFADEAAYAKQHKTLRVNVFYATGSLETPENGMKHMVTGQQKYVERLQSRNYQGLRIKSEVVDGTDHYSTFPVGLSKGLMWLYKDIWQLD